MMRALDFTNWIANTPKAVTAPNPALYFRRTISVKDSIKVATLRFAALGVVEPWINGGRVSDDYFTPGWSDFRKRAYVSLYDVSHLLNPGKNSLGFILADGWAGPPFGPKAHELAFAPRTMFAVELEVVYADGNTERFTTGEEWCWRAGPIVRQSIYHGETVDARKMLPGWADPEISRRGWKPVSIVRPPDIELTPKECAPVRVTEKIAPVKIWTDSERRSLIDFGQNLVGVTELRLRKTKPGQRVVLRFAEMLDATGGLYLENLRDAEVTDTYICGGADEEVFSPRFTFHGFRYARIEGLATALEASDITALVLHNDLAPAGKFSCGSSLVNQLQSCIVWGQRGNFLEAPTDCPQRDERLGWSGDAQVFVETACFNYDCEDFYRQWMDAMRDGQREDGAFPDVAPDILGAHGNAGWGDAGILVPHAIWQHYGSLKIVRENWKAMEAYMAFLEQRADGFIQPETVFGDWLAVDAVRPEWGPTPKDLIGTAYFARDAQLMARMAEALGKSRLAHRYAQLAGKIARAFQRRFITSDGLVLGDSQTSYLLALGFDLVGPSLVEKAGRRLVDRIRARDWHLSTGFLGTPLLAPVLTKLGYSDVAYRLLFQETYPSWLFPVKNGATTMWERWNSWTPDAGFGPVEMNSFNHYAYGAIGEWLYGTVAGIAPDPDYPGFERAIIRPVFNKEMRKAKASLVTRAGRYECGWTIKKGQVEIVVKIPKGGEGTLWLPVQKWTEISMNGKTVPPARRLEGSKKETGTRQLRLPAGSHRFSIPADGVGPGDIG